MTRILDISAYRFTPLADPAAWRARIQAEAARHALLGTVLLAAEAA